MITPEIVVVVFFTFLYIEGFESSLGDDDDRIILILMKTEILRISYMRVFNYFFFIFFRTALLSPAFDLKACFFK